MRTIDRGERDTLVQDNKKSAGPLLNPIGFGEDVQFWTEKVTHSHPIGGIVFTIKASGRLLDTQTPKNHLSGHTNA